MVMGGAWGRWRGRLFPFAEVLWIRRASRKPVRNLCRVSPEICRVILEFFEIPQNYGKLCGQLLEVLRTHRSNIPRRKGGKIVRVQKDTSKIHGILSKSNNVRNCSPKIIRNDSNSNTDRIVFENHSKLRRLEGIARSSQ